MNDLQNYGRLMVLAMLALAALVARTLEPIVGTGFAAMIGVTVALIWCNKATALSKKFRSRENDQFATDLTPKENMTILIAGLVTASGAAPIVGAAFASVTGLLSSLWLAIRMMTR